MTNKRQRKWKQLLAVLTVTSTLYGSFVPAYAANAEVTNQEIEQVGTEVELSASEVQSYLDQGFTISDLKVANAIAKTDQTDLKTELGNLHKQIATTDQLKAPEIRDETKSYKPVSSTSDSSASGISTDSTTSATTEPSVQPPDPDAKLNTAPYMVPLSDSSISPLTGSMNIHATDMTLIGRNGLDFSLSRSYDTSGSQLYEQSTYWHNDTEEVRRYHLGAGWSWDIPYIIPYSTSGSTSTRYYLRMADGGVFAIRSSDLKLDGYPLQDLIVTRDSTVTVDGQTSLFSLESLKEGRKQYFDKMGRLIQISDLYGNYIQFLYYLDSYSLTKISNNIGNFISIQYDNNQHTISLQQANQSVVLTKQKYQYTIPNDTVTVSKELLVSVKDANNRLTQYGYDVKDAALYTYGIFPCDYDPYALLSQVNHPTGASTVFKYEDQPVKRWRDDMINQDFYRVKSIEHQIVFTDGTTKSYGKQTPIYNMEMGTTYLQDGWTISNDITDGLKKTSYTYKLTYAGWNNRTTAYNTQVVTSDLSGKAASQVVENKYDENSGVMWIPIATTKYVSKAGTSSEKTVTSQTFDVYGNILTSTDEMGHQSTMTYDSLKHRLISASKSLSATESLLTQYTLDPDKGSILQETTTDQSAQGAKTLKQISYDYDTSGNITGVHNFADGKEIRTTLTYNQNAPYNGAFLTSKKSLDIETKYDYDTITGNVTKITDGLGNSTSYQYDVLGRLTQKTNPDSVGSKVTLKYDDLKNTVEQTNETGQITRAVFNPLGMKTETDTGVKDASGTITYTPTATYNYDTYGRQIATLDAKQNLTQVDYDSFGRQSKITAPDQSVSTFTYDDVNNKITTVDPDQNTFRETHDKLGHVTLKELVRSTDDPDLVTNTYDALGNLIAVKDSKNQTTQYTYDALNQLTSVIDPQNTTTKYTYDMSGHVTQITNADFSTVTKKYDDLGRLIQQTDSLGQVQNFTYDANGNLISQMDRNGKTTVLTYNSRNQLIQKTADATTNTSPVSYEYDLSGHRTKMTDETGETKYHYNALGQLDTVTYPDLKTLTYTYDSNGNVASLQEPFGKTVTYNLNNMDRLQNVVSGSTTAAQYTYKKGGALASLQQANGMNTTYDYNEFNFVKSEVQKKADNTVTNTFSYNYDLNNNQTGKTENAVQNTFGYDALNRISTSTQFNETYAYDVRGNRQTQSSDKLSLPSLNTYEYDGYNQLKKVTTPEGKVVTYKYNGDGLMTERTENGVTTRYYYDGTNIIAEANVVNSTTVSLAARYLRGQSGQLISREDAAGNTAYYTFNGHGDVTELRDSSGTVLNTYTYDIWGNPQTTQETVTNPFRYAGEFWDTTVTLQYLRARWYNPFEGRFINEDTDQGKTDHTLSLNLYSYVENNPLRYIDSTGHNLKDAGYGDDSSSSELPESSGSVGLAEVAAEAETIGASVGRVATKSNYRVLYLKAYPGLPEDWQVHHTLPQKYESMMKDAGINIHEVKYLRGVDAITHRSITKEWYNWDKNLDHVPSADDVVKFSEYIDEKYGSKWYKP